ncbi:MAG: hypothetical protein L6R28_05845 [Planctomycetes bacterium]|nr:hypothetical protein [Planctomycetota bacterium]
MGLILLYRMGRALFAGKGIPLSEWFATFLAGAATATFSAMLIPEGDEAPIERTKLTVIIVALSFVSAFAGSAFAWYHVSTVDEQDPRRRWRVLFAGWVLAVGSWVGLFAYYAAKAK